MKRTAADRIARQTWIAFIIMEAGFAVLLVAALLDVVVGIGWGVGWIEVLGIVGIAVWGGLIYLISRAWYRFMKRAGF